MGKPRLIIIIRHAQSEGNKNRDIHQTIPDHRVKLTQEGWQQAYEAGRRLRGLLRPDDTLHFFTSPYRRTRETTEGILATLTSEEPESSPFNRSKIKVYEEPRLREQDFGNFQPCSAEMERMWQERADYGHFFYRIPNGESAADAYDRISGFNESLWRQFGEEDFASVCVLVTHGLMSRVFLMKWYHFSVEYFEDLRNVNHCEFLIMRQDTDTGKYILENKLRTWSDLKRESALEAAKKEAEGNGKSKDASKLTRAGSVEVRRRWGGCPNGCNHDKSFKIRQTLADLVKNDSIISSEAVGLAPSESSGSSGASSDSNNTAVNKNGDGQATPTPPSTGSSVHGLTDPSFNGTACSHTQTLVSRRPAAKRFQSQTPSTSDNNNPTFDLSVTGPQIDVTKAREEVVSSPDGTPSFISVDDRLRSHLKSPHRPPHPLESLQLHLGRDGGGTYSGHNSVASASDADSSEDERHRHRRHHHDPIRHNLVSVLNGTNGKNGSAKHTSTNSSSDTLSVKGSALPHHHHRERDHSRMGRGMRANRLGDHHSSDGEHEADGEHEPADAEGDDSGPELGRTLTEMAEESILEAEKEDRSIRGSVY
ncbi:broad-range acid phosphatase DET1 [Podospora australis]|uniref:Broad-range acid phosphatase DET1 n=1 Tax=Podospora australis TaxID=1536484 RepID=A0AAN6WXN0_9PEZI|nr:broad-range acid phosphatase DET1 [Podospora australis]